MSSPTPDIYATVIVPTHDRAATLALAVGSIQRQSVPNIEIVIAGDGATAGVRAVAQDIADTDPRIVFHDFPKAPGRGGENRNRAVEMAKGERIFYCDDDDLLLPHHVETLGPLLDQYDAADSPAACVSCSGSVQLGLVNHARGALREVLAAGTAKAVFDTHFAHRKSTYRRLGRPWVLNGHRIALDFFQSFAADPSIRWRTVPQVTALSFNGRGRAHLTAEARRSELERWQQKIAGDARWLDDAFYDWHLFRLARAMGGGAPRTIEDFMAATFIGVNGLSSGAQADVSYTIPPARLADLRDLFALIRGEAVESVGLGDLAARLADPLIGWARPNAGGRVGAALKSALGAERMLAALARIGDSEAHAWEMRAFLECWLFMSERKPAEALQRMVQLIKDGAFYRGEAHVQAALACRKLDESRSALKWAYAAIRSDPTLKSGHAVAVRILIECGRFEDARRTAADARGLLPDHISAALVQRVEAAKSSAPAVAAQQPGARPATPALS